MYFINKTLEYIFLPSCGVCGKLGEGYLCAKCGKELENYEICARELLCGLQTYNRVENHKEVRNSDNNTDNLEIEKENLKENAGSIEKNKLISSILEFQATADNEMNLKNIEKFHVLKYKDLVRKLIIQYKFNDKSYLYKTFCEFIVKNKKAFDFIKSYDIIIPVPIHKKRMKERGYNQSELIAKELARISQIKCYTDILIKTKNNKPQSTLSGDLRKENTKNVYKLINQEKINNKKVLLFDDIYTTGATAKECIKELEKANVKKISVMTLAKD